MGDEAEQTGALGVIGAGSDHHHRRLINWEGDRQSEEEHLPLGRSVSPGEEEVKIARPMVALVLQRVSGSLWPQGEPEAVEGAPVGVV